MPCWHSPRLLAACSTQDLKPEPGRVTVYRDTWGVPHIYGDTEEAGYYGLGYAQAEDGLQRVLGATFWAQGRSAELLGDAALPNDIEFRRWRHYEEAKQGFARLSPQLQRNYRAFVAGIKRYMADHADQVPNWAPDADAGNTRRGIARRFLVLLQRAVGCGGVHQGGSQARPRPG